MDNVKQYIFSVITAALICSIVNSWGVGKGAYAAVIKLICGLFLTITIVSPMTNIQLSDPEAYFDRLSQEADAVSTEGQLMAKRGQAALMKENLENYVIKKATSVGVEITADITVDDETMEPIRITITGVVSPYSKRILSLFIQEELGIGEVDQIWM